MHEGALTAQSTRPGPTVWCRQGTSKARAQNKCLAMRAIGCASWSKARNVLTVCAQISVLSSGALSLQSSSVSFPFPLNMAPQAQGVVCPCLAFAPQVPDPHRNCSAGMACRPAPAPRSVLPTSLTHFLRTARCSDICDPCQSHPWAVGATGVPHENVELLATPARALHHLFVPMQALHVQPSMVELALACAGLQCVTCCTPACPHIELWLPVACSPSCRRLCHERAGEAVGLEPPQSARCDHSN